MKRLTVLYDASCGFCVRCRHWLEGQRQLLELAFVPARTAEANRRFPGLAQDLEELVVVSDDGGVYRGARAFVMCLYALETYRDWALRLGQPALLPLARRAFALLSHGRRGLSRLLQLAPETELAETLARVRVAPARCAQGGCDPPRDPPR